VYRRVVLVDAARMAVGRWLSDGAMSGPIGHVLARVHAPFASRGVARPLVVPHELTSITVGGATLGGSGKTRVALACTRELARRGVRVVLIGHAYRARPRVARIVSPSDALADVGDEALACARDLADLENASVVVAPTRQAAIDFVRADAVVIDGPLQLSPTHASLSLLAVDAESPWGAGDVAPAGDLRAPRGALLANADHVVYVDALPRGATIAGQAIELSSLVGARVGLFTALARPGRLVRALARVGIELSHVVRVPDHGPSSTHHLREMSVAKVDVWLATAKCALHIKEESQHRLLAIFDGSTTLPLEVTNTLARFVGAAPTSVA
jgi:tetraacyldisaccharide 4'-kinase